MARVTPEEYAAKQATRLKAALSDVSSGIDRVRVSPMSKAADQAPKMLAKISESINSGRWAANTRKVTLQEWQTKTKEKGIPRIAGGIDAAHDKQVAFASKLLPAVDAAAAKVNAMPSVTLEDGINRMTTFVRDMAKFKK
ncbi:MAG: hypothetical protein Q7N50_04060 [Armatimonadota bacterium]|nr:hypothetical protein [Armatimonadota bacterium]